jgi:hypothetical protein
VTRETPADRTDVASNTVAPGSRRRSALTIGATTAHLTAPPELSQALLNWFQRHETRWCLQPRYGTDGTDLIDFGNPSTGEEMRIRALFARRQTDNL